MQKLNITAVHYSLPSKQKDIFASRAWLACLSEPAIFHFYLCPVKMMLLLAGRKSQCSFTRLSIDRKGKLPSICVRNKCQHPRHGNHVFP